MSAVVGLPVRRADPASCARTHSRDWPASQYPADANKPRLRTDGGAMPTETDHDLDEINVGEPEHWEEGPPHELFRRLRGECPVHWSEIEEYPDEAGFWSVVTAEDVHTVSRDWQTYSSERGGCMALTHA